MLAGTKLLYIAFFLSLSGALLATAQDKDKFPTGTYEIRGWPMVFREDKTYKIGDDKQTFVEGKYAVEGNQITFTDESGQYACQGDGKTGVYRWEFKEERLTLHPIKDNCEARRTAFLEGPLRKVK